MSDEPNVNAGNETKENIEKSPVKDPLAVEISKEIKENIAKSGDVIRAKVIQHLVQAEVDLRCDMLVNVLQKRDTKWRELQKINPDQVVLNENGSTQSSGWSKNVLKKRGEITKDLNKMDMAINRAFSNADYDSLKKYA